MIFRRKQKRQRVAYHATGPADQQRVEKGPSGDGPASAEGKAAESCKKTNEGHPRGEINFWAIDVETANADYASICQVGVVRVVDGAMIDEYVTLVDPEDWFDPWNTALHGITPRDVKNQPTCQQYWSGCA